MTDASAGLVNGRLIAAAGPVFSASGSTSVDLVDLDASRIEGATGSVYVGSLPLTVNQSEIAGIDGAEGVAVLHLSGTAASLAITNSALFGSVSRTAPLISAEGDVVLVRSTLAGNVVMGDADLIEVAASRSGVSPLVSFDRTVVSRNELVGAADPSPSPILGRWVAVPPAGDFCLPIGADGEDYLQRPPADSAGASPSDGALVHISATISAFRPHVLIQKSFFVENVQGPGAALIKADGHLADFQVSLVHNTVALAPGVDVVAITGTGAAARVATARNLFVATPTLDLGAVVEIVEASLDVVVGEVTPWWEGLTLDGLRGPHLVGPVDWLPLDPLDPSLADDCGQASQTCAELEGACSGLFAGGNERFCPYDLAIQWVPDPTDFTDLRPRWPWEATTLV